VSKFENVKAAKAKANAHKNSKKQKEPNSLGSAYKAKNAGGDRKRKGQKYEPYVFVPLDAKSYTKKIRGKTVAEMESVVKRGKRKR